MRFEKISIFKLLYLFFYSLILVDEVGEGRFGS